MAILLALPPAVYYYWSRPPEDDEPAVEGQKTTLLHPHLEQLRRSYEARRPGRALAGRIYPWLLGLLWTSLVVALMRPQWLEQHTEIQSPGYDLMLTVDASHSMDALDFSSDNRQVTRMQVVKGVMDKFIEGRQGDRVGLTVFGSQAFVLSPLTLDRQAVRQLLAQLVPSIAGQGTALGDAIALSAKKLRERPEGSRVMVLIADGDNSSGLFPPIEATKLAARAAVRIYVIGVGSTQESIPIYQDGRVQYRNDLSMDESTLKRIASITRGTYFRATDTRALEEIYRQIDELEKTQAETRTAWLPTSLYRWPLGLALICLLALGLFPEGRRRFTARMGSRGLSRVPFRRAALAPGPAGPVAGGLLAMAQHRARPQGADLPLRGRPSAAPPDRQPGTGHRRAVGSVRPLGAAVDPGGAGHGRSPLGLHRCAPVPPGQ
jgi:Ca-activated chloride channel family protein